MTTQQPQQLKIEFGKCPFCGKEIMELDKNNNPVKKEGYSEFWVLLSDESRMKVAKCDKCKVTKAKAEKVITAHKELWRNGIEAQIDQHIEDLKRKKEEEINYYNNLKLVKHGLRERDIE